MMFEKTLSGGISWTAGLAGQSVIISATVPLSNNMLRDISSSACGS